MTGEAAVAPAACSLPAARRSRIKSVARGFVGGGCIAGAAEIKQKMAEYGITVQDLGGRSTRSRKGNPAPVKYRHPATGQTWTGRGKRPR